MPFFYRPGGIADERIVEEVLLCLFDEHLPSFTLQRRDATFLNGLGASAKPTEEFFDVELSHGNLLVNLERLMILERRLVNVLAGKVRVVEPSSYARVDARP
jgi:hypothetical protein